MENIARTLGTVILIGGALATHDAYDCRRLVREEYLRWPNVSEENIRTAVHMADEKNWGDFALEYFGGLIAMGVGAGMIFGAEPLERWYQGRQK